MAVGMIITCETCGKSYDEGRTMWHECDGGAALREIERSVAEFNSKSVDERLEYLYRESLSLRKAVRNIPFDGQIG